MYRFRESAISWLKRQKFSDQEIEKLQGIMNGIGPKPKQKILKLPKNTEAKISAMVYILGSITDEEGKLACFDGKLIGMPEEARRYYEDEVSMQELEDEISKKGIKLGRLHSSPRRRGTVKKEY